MSVIIGIDPHKLLHAACVIDRTEVELAELQVRAGPRQLAELLAWAAPFECRTWAIESAGGLGYLLAQQLVARGEHVVDVPATLSSRTRLLGSGRSNKNDANDARAVAIAALRSPSMLAVRAEDHVSVLRLLAKAQLDVVTGAESGVLPAACVGARVGGGRDPQGSRCHTSRTDPRRRSSRSTRHSVNDSSSRMRPSKRSGLLDARLKRSKARITEAVTASATSLTDIFGVGPIIAALIIGYTGDVTRFATAGHFAAYNGTAPIEFSSSGHTVHRLSRRGNRTLNHAIHMIAVTQIRHAHSEGRSYYDRKITEGHKPRASEARTEASDLRSRVPPAASRRRRQVGPGGQSGNDSLIQRGRQTPGTRHFGSSHSRTQTPTLRPPTRPCHGRTRTRPDSHIKDPLDTKRDRSALALATGFGHDALMSNDATGDDIVENDLLQALAGAVLLRDRLADAGDSEGTALALLTVDARNAVDVLAVDHPSGLAGCIPTPRPTTRAGLCIAITPAI